MSTLAAAERLAGQAPSEKQEFGHGELKIRGNTLVIGNSIYAIDNISTVTFADLRRPVPAIVWIILGVGLLCMMSGDSSAILRLFGWVLVGLAIYLLFLNWKSRAGADYGLAIHMNGGNTAVVLQNNMEFLKAIALELYEVIELERSSYATFNIDQSVKIDNITGSVVPVGGVSGDIVNNVQGI